jgi:holliday junction DNA helicase RuvA
MYEYIKGTLDSLGEGVAVIDCHGVGYLMSVPGNVTADTFQEGKEARLYTALVIRENDHTLYGFATKMDRDLFSLLVEINGIGPKTALNIISCFSVERLKEAVEVVDATALCRVPGIGKKTAERLLVDLKSKLPALVKMDITQASLGLSPQPLHSGPIRDAISALMNLGYSQMAAQQAVKQVMGTLSETADASAVIAAALQSGVGRS